MDRLNQQLRDLENSYKLGLIDKNQLIYKMQLLIAFHKQSLKYANK